MGAPGTFQAPQLRKLIGGVASTIGRLKDKRTITSVLIGSGAGNLEIPESIQGYLDGLCDAFDAYPDLRIDRLRLVEINLDKAAAMLHALEQKAATPGQHVRFHVKPKLVKARGRRVPVTFSFSMLLGAVARQTRSSSSALRPWLRTLLRQLPQLPDVETDVVGQLRAHAEENRDLARLALSFPIATRDKEPAREVPTRLVFSFDGRYVRTSAITETSTVTEREVSIRQGLFDELTLLLTRSNGLELRKFGSLARYAFQRLLHREMEPLFQDGRSTILEVNRSIAGLPFEMLVTDSGTDPLSVRVPFARQLRTTYSPPPVSAPARGIERALVIGDPGEGDYALEACRKEADHVRALLVKAGIETTLLVQ